MNSNKLPSVLSTYQSAFRLYTQTYLTILPFILGLVGISLLIDHWFPIPKDNASLVSHSYWINFVLTLLTGALFLCFVTLCIDMKRSQKKIDYLYVIIKGFTRFPSLIFSNLILIGPMILMGALLFMFMPSEAAIAQSEQSPASLLLIPLALLAFIVAIGSITMYVYCFIAGILIILKWKSAWAGLKESYQITKGHWLKTFVISTILMSIYLLTALILQKIVPNYFNAIKDLLTFSLWPCIAIMHAENLEKIYIK